jgi:uncharacterized delta-60 repeat protein
MTGIMQVKLSNFALGGGNFIALLGGAGSDVGQSIVLDSSGNIYVCGYQTPADQYLQLAKYNAGGTIQWQVSLNTISGENLSGLSLKLDSSNNIYVAGNYSATGPISYMAIVKYNSSGTLQWQNKYGTSVIVRGNYIALDSSSNVYLCGTTGTNNQLAVVKYNSSGTEVWKQEITAASGATQGLGIALDSSNNVYIGGYISPSTQVQMYLIKLNSAGTLQWQVILYDFATSTNANINAVTVDSANNIYVCGVSAANGAGNDMQLAKYNSSGTLQWQKSLGAASTDSGAALVTDASNNVYVCGRTVISTNEVLIAKYNSSGTIQWQRSLGGSGLELGLGITVDTTNVYICGRSDGLGTTDFLIANLPSDGTKTGTYSVGGYSMTYAASSLTDTTSTLTATTGSATLTTSTMSTSATTFTSATSTLTSTVTNL